MIEIYVVTGFLGAGKTTIIKTFLKQIKDRKVNLIVNEFGKESVDDILLERQAEYLESIHNGSIFCACKLEDMRHAMVTCIKRNPDVVIIETSGLTNPESVYNIINQKSYPQISKCYVITVVDNINFNKVFKNVVAVEKQLEVADMIIINKWDNQYSIIERVKEINSNAKISYTPDGVVGVSLPTTKIINNTRRIAGIKDLTNTKYLLQVGEHNTMSDILAFVELLTKICNRIKGIVTIDRKNYLIESVMDRYTIKEIHAKQTGLVVLGNTPQLTKKKIQQIILNQQIHVIIV